MSHRHSVMDYILSSAGSKFRKDDMRVQEVATKRLSAAAPSYWNRKHIRTGPGMVMLMAAGADQPLYFDSAHSRRRMIPRDVTW